MDELHYKVSKDERAWLDFVLTERPEPPQHRCGKCRTPWGITNPNCPGRAAESRR
jgi:hypothetical protein